MPMPMGDLFAPDINFVAARSVYPTSPGGTAADAASAMSNTTNTYVPNAMGGGGAAVVANGPISTGGHGGYWWLGLVGLLIVLVFVARKAGGDEDFRNIKPTAYNALAIVLTSILGTVGLKVIFAKWHIPGASDVILAA